MATWGPIGHVQLLRRCPKLIDIVKILPQVGMCLKENYTDSPSNEYSRHYSAESEYLRRQVMNSKSAEEQKKVITSVEVLISTKFGNRAKKRSK